MFFFFSGHYLVVEGTRKSFGQIAAIASPRFYFTDRKRILVDISIKIRDDDDLPALKVSIHGEESVHSELLRMSTDGFVEHQFYAGPGEVFLVFEAIWGRHSRPFFAIDNVTIADLDYDDDDDFDYFNEGIHTYTNG